MLNLQPSSTAGSDPEPLSDHYLSLISAHISSLTPQLRNLSLSIHSNPELRYKEFHAHEVLTSFLEKQRSQEWRVTRSAYGIATAFVAVFEGEGEGPVVGFNAEYGMFCLSVALLLGEFNDGLGADFCRLQMR